MRNLVLLIVACCPLLGLLAQEKAPKWMNKQKKALVTITTYGVDNQKKAEGVGFFISETGEALSGYSVFKGAERATVTDTEGKVYPVVRIMGADELYDVIKFKAEVPKKVDCLAIGQETVPQGATAYLMPFSTEKKVKFGKGAVSEVSKLKDPFSYYKLSIPLEAGWTNAPILTEEGKVFGLAQEDATGNKDVSYAVSAGYANSLTIHSADVLNSTYTQIGIRKAWPADVEQAQVALFLLANSQDPKTYLETLNDFIASFPESAEGYLSRANHYAYHRAALASSEEERSAFLDKALEDIDAASRFSDSENELWYNRAKLIYGVAAMDTTLKDERWTVDAALEAVQKAIGGADLPAYRQLEGDIYFYQKRFEQAYDDYMKVNQSEIASPSSWYLAAKAKSNVFGVNIGEIINLLDSAIAKCGNPPTPEAATYILERIDYRLRLMQYPEAVADYDLYYTILNGQVGDRFYYYREQAKFRMDDFAGALEDIKAAIRLNPGDAMYRAEEASVYIRQENYEAALKSVDESLKIAPDFASSYRLRGICLVRQGKKDEACEAFQKAKELGDPVVDKLIKQHCQ